MSMKQNMLDRAVFRHFDESQYQGLIIYVCDLDGPDPDVIHDQGLNEATRALLEREGYQPLPAYEVSRNVEQWGVFKHFVEVLPGWVIPTERGTAYLIAAQSNI